MEKAIHIQTQLGPVHVMATSEDITAIGFGRLGNAESGRSPLLLEAKKQLEYFFCGRLFRFDLPLLFVGTEFQHKVRKAMLAIPYGDVVTYGGVAQAIGHAKAVRAVGGACHVNPHGIVVPCHRVIGAGGALTGYASGLRLKMALLDLESKRLADARIYGPRKRA